MEVLALYYTLPGSFLQPSKNAHKMPRIPHDIAPLIAAHACAASGRFFFGLDKRSTQGAPHCKLLHWVFIQALYNIPIDTFNFL